MLQDEDIFLRLPCDDKKYEEQIESNAPLLQTFLEDLAQENKETSSLGGMAHLVHISSIWGDVITQTTRLSRSSANTYEARYRSLHSRIQGQIRQWQSSLPPTLAVPHALEADHRSHAEPRNQAALPLTLLLLRATTQLLLHRHINRKALPPELIESNIQQCSQDAEVLLHQFETLVSSPVSDQLKDIRDLYGAGILEYAVAMIWDVLNSSRNCTISRDRIEAVLLKVLDEIKSFWHPARTRRREILDTEKRRKVLIPMDLDAAREGNESDVCTYHV